MDFLRLYAIIISYILNKGIIYLKRNCLKRNSFKYTNILLVIIFIFISFFINIKNVKRINWNEIRENYKMVFKDKNVQLIHIDGVWGTIGADCGLTQILREKNTPIYNLESELFESSEKAKNQYYKNISDNTNIYVLIDSDVLFRKLNNLENEGFETEEIRTYTSSEIPYLKNGKKLFLYKIRRFE